MSTKETKYKQKAISSFKTKLEIYLFYNAVYGKLTSISQKDFEDFKITDNVVNIYATEYWQYKKDEKINGILIQEIENSILDWKKSNEEKIRILRNHYVVYCFPEIFTRKDFNDLLENTKCNYCNISINEIEKLADKKKLYKKNFRGWSLEIDRFDSNREYTLVNCCMACYWCNNAKTDEFTKDEFILISGGISKIWEARINAESNYNSALNLEKLIP